MIMANIFIVLEIVAICVIFFALGLVLFGEDAKEQKLMAFFMVGSLVQNAGYLLELLAPSLDAAVTSVKMQYLGSLFIPLFYCWFIFYYCYQKAPRKFLEVLALINIVLLVVIFTCDRHQLYYRGVEWLVTEEGHYYLSIRYGPGYVIFMLFSCILPYSMSIYALFHVMIVRRGRVGGRRYLLIMILQCMPIASLLAYAMKLTYVFDLTPAVLGIVLSMVVILVWSRRIYDFRTLASGVVLNSMGDGVIALDDQKRIVSYNQAAAGIFTELGAKAVGESISYLKSFPEEILEENDKKEFCVGERFYESHVKQITEKTSKSKGYVVLVLDVTETKKYIDEIKSVREQAERANMAKSEFLANMSHEIRTPMNAIVGLSDIIMEESRGRKVYSYACDIKSASRNLLAIINDILDLSKIEAGKMEIVTSDYYVKNIVGEVVNIMDIAASQRGLLLKCEYDTSIPCRYHGDEGRIKQVLINLLNNAVKFTKEGYVRISVGGTPCGEGMEELMFCVEDTGCGIREDDLEKIFEDFRQVDSRRNRSVEGTGLGLSITKRLVHMMQGNIKVRSVYGQGTIFVVTIPQRIVDARSLEEVPDAPEKEKEQIRSFTVAGNYKVLVVDDNLVNRRVAIGFLKGYGFKISEAASGPEAIGLVRKTKFNIIFMDHMMPEMDGIEAARIIRQDCGENGREPVIIALTANAMEGVREMFLQNGFQDFLAKPLYRKPMNEVLARWIPESDRVYQQEDGAEKQQKDSFDLSDIHINGIDVEEAMLYHSGNADDYVELLELYCADGKRKLSLLNELYEKKDYKNYGIEVHGLKSASANVGAMELSAQAKEHEDAAENGDEEFIGLHFSELLTSYEKQLKSIQNFLDKRRGEGQDRAAQELPKMDREALIREIREALERLEKFRSKECAAKLDALLGYRMDSAVESRLEAVRGQLKLYEDDAAEEMLRELLDELDKEDKS